MFSLRNRLVCISSAAVVLIGVLLLLKVPHWCVPRMEQTPLDAVFTTQFDSMQRLVLSLLQSTPQIQCLRVDSVALEDLSYALTMAPAEYPNDGIREQIYALSREVDAVAELMQRLYVEVDLLIHLATATSQTLGKAFERQPNRLVQYLCQKLRFCISTHHQDITNLHLTIQGYFDVLSNAIESPAFLATTLVEAHQCLQLHVYEVVSAIALQINVPIGQNCLPLLVLWDQSDPDGEEFSTSSRNAEALRSFCSRLAQVGRHVDADIASMHVLRDALSIFCRLASTGAFTNLEPSLPKKLYQNSDSILGLRLKKREEDNQQSPAVLGDTGAYRALNAGLDPE